MDDSYRPNNSPAKARPGLAGYAGPRDAADIRQMRLGARRELEQARKIRDDACRYQQETAVRACSEAQRLLLEARLAIQKEIENITRQATEEVQKVLADIRVIRITAEEELAAQRKFTDAARLCSRNSMPEEHHKPEAKTKKQSTRRAVLKAYY